MKDTFTRRVILRIGIAFGLIAVFVVFIIILNVDINKHTKNIEEMRSAMTSRIEAINLLSELKREAASAAPYAATISAVLPTRDQLVGFPRDLQKIATADKVDFGFSFGSETAAKDNEPGSIRFTMTLTGTLANLIAFLKELEANPYFISLVSEDLTRKLKDTYTLSISGEIYIR